MPPVIFVSIRIPKSTSIAAIALKADSKPPFQPLWMLYNATAKDSQQSARDCASKAINTMGLLRKIM
jgi:hypothetical protein